jgi:hypothetical protein
MNGHRSGQLRCVLPPRPQIAATQMALCWVETTRFDCFEDLVTLTPGQVGHELDVISRALSALGHSANSRIGPEFPESRMRWPSKIDKSLSRCALVISARRSWRPHPQQDHLRVGGSVPRNQSPRSQRDDPVRPVPRVRVIVRGDHAPDPDHGREDEADARSRLIPSTPGRIPRAAGRSSSRPKASCGSTRAVATSWSRYQSA